jgi:hypothetical protein
LLVAILLGLVALAVRGWAARWVNERVDLGALENRGALISFRLFISCIAMIVVSLPLVVAFAIIMSMLD